MDEPPTKERTVIIHTMRHAKARHRIDLGFTDYEISDADLSLSGFRHCRYMRTIGLLEDINFIDHVISSPLRRALRTAAYCMGQDDDLPNKPLLVHAGLQNFSSSKHSLGMKRHILAEWFSSQWVGKLDLTFVPHDWHRATHKRDGGMYSSSASKRHSAGEAIRYVLQQYPAQQHVEIILLSHHSVFGALGLPDANNLEGDEHELMSFRWEDGPFVIGEGKWTRMSRYSVKLARGFKPTGVIEAAEPCRGKKMASRSFHTLRCEETGIWVN